MPQRAISRVPYQHRSVHERRQPEELEKQTRSVPANKRTQKHEHAVPNAHNGRRCET